jgi:hypothetical protein
MADQRMADKAKEMAASLLSKGKAAAQLVAKQAERTKFANITLPNAYQALGKHVHNAGAFRDDLGDIYQKIDCLLKDIEAHSTPGAKAEGFAEKAKAVAKATQDMAHVQSLQLKANRAFTELGTAAFEKHGEASGPTEAVQPVVDARARLEKLDSEISQLSQTQTGQIITPKRIAIGGLGVVVLALLFLVRGLLFNSGTQHEVTKPTVAQRSDDNAQRSDEKVSTANATHALADAEQRIHRIGDRSTSQLRENLARLSQGIEKQAKERQANDTSRASHVDIRSKANETIVQGDQLWDEGKKQEAIERYTEVFSESWGYRDAIGADNFRRVLTRTIDYLADQDNTSVVTQLLKRANAAQIVLLLTSDKAKSLAADIDSSTNRSTSNVKASMQLVSGAPTQRAVSRRKTKVQPQSAALEDAMKAAEQIKDAKKSETRLKFPSVKAGLIEEYNKRHSGEAVALTFVVTDITRHEVTKAPTPEKANALRDLYRIRVGIESGEDNYGWNVLTYHDPSLDGSLGHGLTGYWKEKEGTAYQIGGYLPMHLAESKAMSVTKGQSVIVISGNVAMYVYDDHQTHQEKKLTKDQPVVLRCIGPQAWPNCESILTPLHNTESPILWYDVCLHLSSVRIELHNPSDE